MSAQKEEEPPVHHQPLYDKRRDPTPGLHATAGAVGGVVALAITYPLMTVSMLLQTERKKSQMLQDNKYSLKDEGTKNRSSSGEGEITLRGIIKEYGVSRLYSGIASALYGQLIIQFVYYYAYSFVRRVLGEHKGKQLSTAEDILSASVAGVTGATVTNPLWVINARKVVDKHANQDSLTVAAHILREEGVGAFFNGLLPAYVLVVNPIIAYVTFEALKKIALRITKAKALTPGLIFLLGSIGKLLATVITYPTILAKTLQQAKATDCVDGSRADSSFVTCLTTIVKTQGFGGLYKGLQSKVYQSVLCTALMFVL
eukprot:PhF_6_TR3674/c0_g1_i2/m.5185/K13354/SLC25A17, PMP34; solute carrier family 25 (peroxisomal adenine nucleotide transporter), member 17